MWKDVAFVVAGLAPLAGAIVVQTTEASSTAKIVTWLCAVGFLFVCGALVYFRLRK